MLRIYPEAFFCLPQDILHSDFNKTNKKKDNILLYKKKAKKKQKQKKDNILLYKKKAKKKAKTKTKIVNYKKKIIKTTYYIKCPLYVLDFKRLFLHG
jgi:hypothetical protein